LIIPSSSAGLSGTHVAGTLNNFFELESTKERSKKANHPKGAGTQSLCLAQVLGQGFQGCGGDSAPPVNCISRGYKEFGGACMPGTHIPTNLLRSIVSWLFSVGFLLVFVLSFLILLSPNTACPVDVTLAWDANTEEDLAGYKVFYREDGQSYDYKIPAWEGTDTTCTIYNLDDNAVYYFAARACDTLGNESGDSNEVSHPPSINVAPTADAGPDQTVHEEQTVTLDGSNSTDVDGTIVSYLWAQTGNISVTLSDPTLAQPTFTAPYVDSTGAPLTFQLTVTDNGGLTDTDTVIINVSNVNHAPTADAGPDQTVDEGQTVTLDGSNSFDPDGSVVSYSWTQIGGITVTLSEKTAVQPTFTAPDVGRDGASLTFQLTITDDGGLQSTDTCITNVSWGNVAPTADAGPDRTVDEGQTVTLDGSNSTDVDGSIMSYLWTQVAGTSVTLSDPTSVVTTFAAPDVGPYGEILTFQVTVTDDGGLQDTDMTMTTVNPSSSRPVETIFDLNAKDRAEEIRLNWSSVPDATYYSVYRSLKSDGPYSKVADCHETDGCVYLDTNGVIGVTYYYLVRSVVGGVESADSNKVRATPRGRKSRGK
jgi:fibronectin type 3 domain-containing protein